MTLKEEIYQAVHDHVEARIKQVEAGEGFMNQEVLNGRLLELLHIKNLIYKMFADYNQKLAQQSEVKPVHIDTNELITKHYP